MMSEEQLILKNFVLSSWFYIPLVMAYLCYGFWNEKIFRVKGKKTKYEVKEAKDALALPYLNDFKNYYKAQYETIEKKTQKRIKDLSQSSAKTIDVKEYKAQYKNIG